VNTHTDFGLLNGLFKQPGLKAFINQIHNNFLNNKGIANKTMPLFFLREISFIP